MEQYSIQTDSFVAEKSSPQILKALLPAARAACLKGRRCDSLSHCQKVRLQMAGQNI
jgi:hypothetical protein